ncbi:inorganic pyrophosphatase [Candidatus Nitrosacidococcus tergens]|uniref:inorganic diphosphatase n=1 Tax=Candidatus Nitrosacidococcus tergens TaxID=553981 RepID=A0A7G1QA24_9GAMM|nr:inorganic pyrophosphatase [Candidatus Nitrosacidococcus tergens]CAB1276150.1 Inorganic pyrophosphatase [Candidatus Nitrosacidococcus tergens]
MTATRDFPKYRLHPWHGAETGATPPEFVHAYIEITPFDPIKYELDKVTGCLRVDRPQHGSSLPPSLYGLIPRTYSADKVASLCDGADRGDGDPLDICVITERPVNRSDILLEARVIGGIQTIDRGEVDDKIIAVLKGDSALDSVKDIIDLPSIYVERLRHYFVTYKMVPDQLSPVTLGKTYDRDHAFQVVQASMEDYAAAYIHDK